LSEENPDNFYTQPMFHIMKKTITELLLDPSVQKIEKRELQVLKGRKNYSTWKQYFPVDRPVFSLYSS